MSAQSSKGSLAGRVLWWIFVACLVFYVVKFPEAAADSAVSIIEGFGSFVGHFAEKQAKQ